MYNFYEYFFQKLFLHEFLLFLRRKLLRQVSHHYESANRKQTFPEMGYWNIVSKMHPTDGLFVGYQHLEGKKNPTTEVTHHWNHKQQVLSIFLHAKHQLLKKWNFAQTWKMGGWSNVSSAGKLILQRLLLSKSPFLFLWSTKGKWKRADRGSAAREVQEVTGERFVRNAVFTFLSHCWKLTEEWRHWWASRNLSWAFMSQVKLFKAPHDPESCLS